MKSTMQYSVGGNIIDVADDRYDEFLADYSQDYEGEPEEVYTYYVNGDPVQVKASRLDEFMADCAADGVTPSKMRNFKMDDGQTLRLDENAVQQFVQARRTGQAMSRGLLKQTGIPEQYGRSAAEREALADAFGGFYPDDDTRGGENLGDRITGGIDRIVSPIREVGNYMKTAKESKYGRDVSVAEAIGANLPFVGSVMDANENRKEEVMRRLYDGDYRDSLEANRLALSIGIPQETLRELNEKTGSDDDAKRAWYAQLVKDDLANRILTKQEKGERLSEYDLNVLQKVAVGGAGLVKTVAEMSNPVTAAMTTGTSAMNRAADLNRGEWTVDAEGNPVQTMTGDGGDLSMLKGFVGAAAERAIWMNKLPGSAALKKKTGRNILTRNAAQIGEMTVKSDLSDLVDTVIGLGVPEAQAKKTVGEWAEQHLTPSGASKDFMEAALAHLALKGVRLLTPSGREAHRQEAAKREATYAREDAEKARAKAEVEARSNVEKQARRIEAQSRYDAKMSEETAHDLDREIDEQVKAGTIPEVSRETVRRKVVESAGENVRSLGDADVREKALLEAMYDVTTPTRAKDSAAVERRRVEQKMRESEYWARRSDELEAKYGAEEASRKLADEKAASERRAADEKAKEDEHKRRGKEIQGAFDRSEGEIYKQLYKERKEALAEYERQEAERKAREAEEEQTLQPQEVKVEVNEPTNAEKPLDASENTAREWSEYKTWLQKSGRSNTPKNWNKFIMETERDTALRVDTKDQQAWEQKILAHEGDITKKDPRKPYDYGEAAGEAEERKWDEARATRERVRRQHPEMSDEDFNARWNGFDHGYRKAVAEWEAKKEAAKKNGKKFDEPKPDSGKMEYDFNVANPIDTTPMTATEAAKILGADAYDKRTLTEKLRQWERNPTDANARHRRAAKAMLDKLEGPLAEAPKANVEEPVEAKKQGQSVQEAPKDAGTSATTDAKTEGQKTVESPVAGVPTDKGFEAWAVDSDGKPIEYASEADRKASRETFDILVKRGLVDGATGQRIEAGGAPVGKTAAPEEATTDLKPDGKGKLKNVKRVSAEEEDASFAEGQKKKGRLQKGASVETAEAFRDSVKEDPVLKRIDEAVKKAKTETERNALTDQFKARIGELRNARGGRSMQISDTTPAQKLADPDFKAWAAKKGRVASDGARREYDAEQVDALGKHVAKNWLKGVKFRRTENAAEVPANARQLYSRDGNVVGWYDSATKEVVTLPGADAGTVAHELGWHATYDHAKERAAAGDRTLLDKLGRYANDARSIVVDPTTGQTLEQVITARYGRNGVTDPTALLDEIGAARFTMDNVGKIKDAAARRQAANWYERTWNAVADAYKTILSKMGWNKARIEGIGAMTPEQAVRLVADEMIKGRTLGKTKPSGIDMDKGETFVQRHSRALKDYMRPILELDKDAGNATSGGIHTKMRVVPGKVQAAINEAEAFSRELTDKMTKAGIKTSELNEYMYAMAAGERNAKILRRNGTLDGSAMSHADIQRVLDAYRNSPKHAELENLRREVLAFQKKGFDTRVRAGLVSQQVAHDLEVEEPNHVPMKSRFDAEGNHTGFDANASFGKQEWHKAKGRTNIGDGPLEWIMQEYVDAKSHAATNDARLSLLTTVLSHPEIGSVRKLRAGETSQEIRRKGQSGNPNVVTVKANGDTYQITLNGSRGELIARAMTGRGVARTPQAIQKAMRWWSSTATEWSPTFAGRNVIADTIDVFAVNTAEHGIVGGAVQNAKHVWNAGRLIPEIRKYVKTGKTNDPVLREAIEAGVLMGGGVRSRAFQDADYGIRTLKTDFAQGKNRAKALGKTLFGWVNTLNQTAEMMNRMADYKLQRDAGKSKAESALHAREITVDFNQKGEATPWTNTLYMFSNSALGSTMRLNKAIFTGKHGMQLAAGTFALGLAEGFAEATMNGDDEEGKNVNEYTRASSIYIRNGKDIYRIPMHASPISLIKYAGNCAARKLMGTLGKDKAASQVADDAIGILTQFAGIGDIGDNKTAGIAPTIIQPFIQAWQNRDFADRPIEKTAFTEQLPKSHNGRVNTPEIYKRIAILMNAAGGGNEGRKGKIGNVSTDISPEMIKHFTEAVGKNTLRDAANAIECVNVILGISEPDRRNVPFARDYYRTAGENDDRFFKAYEAYKEDLTELNKRTSWKEGERTAYVKERPWLYKTGESRTIDRMVNGYSNDGVHVMGINDLRKMEQGFVRMKDGSYRKHEWSQDRIDAFRKRRLELQRKVIEKMGY